MRSRRRPWTFDEVMDQLKTMGSQHNIDGMARFGITPKINWGVSNTDLKKLAVTITKDHQLALDLWETGVRDARLLAALIDVVDKVTEDQIDSWVSDFDSWDVCDSVCGYLIIKTPFVKGHMLKWTTSDEEFVKRAGFATMAWYAVHKKKLEDSEFEEFFPVIEREAWDERNFVKKAVSWALRSIGKRNDTMRGKARVVAKRLADRDERAARWIGKDALREFEKIERKQKG